MPEGRGGSSAGFYVAYAVGTTATDCMNRAKYFGSSVTRSDLSTGQVITVSVCAADSGTLVSLRVSSTITIH